jgi:hypothetical protein
MVLPADSRGHHWSCHVLRVASLPLLQLCSMVALLVPTCMLLGCMQVAQQIMSPYAQPPPGKRQRMTEPQQEQVNPRYRDRERRGSDDERDVD